MPKNVICIVENLCQKMNFVIWASKLKVMIKMRNNLCIFGTKIHYQIDFQMEFLDITCLFRTLWQLATHPLTQIHLEKM